MEFPEGGNPLKDASCYLDQWRVLIPSWCRTFHDLGNSLYEKIGSLWIQGIYGYPSAITFESGNGQSHVNGGVDGNRIYQLASFLSIVSLAYQRFKKHMTHMFSAFIFGSFECWSSNRLTERTRIPAQKKPQIPNSMDRQATCRWLPAIPKATPDARCWTPKDLDCRLSNPFPLILHAPPSFRYLGEV